LGMNGEEIHELTGIDPWFLDKLADLMETEKFLKRTPLKSLSQENLFAIKQQGFSDRQIAFATNSSEDEVRVIARVWVLFQSIKWWIPARRNLRP